MPGNLEVEEYLAQVRRWPGRGRHILASFDDATIVVYQAYPPAIADFCLSEGYFGGPSFSYERMSWIKPNFLWMMYRSGWGTKPMQERTLAIRLRRTFFDSLLAEAVPSSFSAARFPSRAAWQRAVAESNVRMQWDPDHDPSGRKLERRAIQLGLRNERLVEFGKNEVMEVLDLTQFVQEQRRHAAQDPTQLRTPRERSYVPAVDFAAKNVGLDLSESMGQSL